MTWPAASSYLNSADDVEKLKRGLKLIAKIGKQEPLVSRLDLNDPSPLLDSKIDQKSDKELEDVVRERVETLYHPTSTCRMAPLEDGGVVDSKLRVYGVRGLRVCDASIFPEIISGHTVRRPSQIRSKLIFLLTGLIGRGGPSKRRTSCSYDQMRAGGREGMKYVAYYPCTTPKHCCSASYLV